MKEPKEYLKEYGFKQYGKECAEEAFNDPELKFVLDAIKQAQVEAYNQAVDDVCQRARLKTVSSNGNINTTSQEFYAYNTVVSVDVDTLKRLKKSVVSTE